MKKGFSSYAPQPAGGDHSHTTQKIGRWQRQFVGDRRRSKRRRSRKRRERRDEALFLNATFFYSNGCCYGW